MRVCIVAKNTDEEARYLYEEFKKKNFSKVFLADLTKLSVKASNKNINIYYKKKFDWDIYVIRALAEDFLFNYLVAEVLPNKAIILPSAKAILHCSSRGLFAKAIFEAKVTQPLTHISLSAESAKKIATRFKKCALKFAKHGGKGVVIVEKSSNVSEFLDVFSHLDQPFCVQKFIKGEITKVLVVGEDVIAMTECPKPGEERSNEGKREHVRINDELKLNLINLAKHLGTFLFEIDLIEKNSRYFAIDVSLTPNLKMYSEISGRNVAAIFADYILQKYS